MHELTGQEWLWICGFLLFALLLSIYHARRASRSTRDYFIASRDTHWWVLGTSIVATTFAVDTPMVIGGLVLTQGLAGNWYWWSVAPSGLLGVFFFAKLWRRSGCVTQAEFAALRYGRGRAKILRLFNVFYHGLFRNAVTLGFVNLAMTKIITACTTLDQWEALWCCFALTVLYTMLGGIRGVMWTDVFQFLLAITSSILVAYYAVEAAGGLGSLSQILTHGWSYNGPVNGDYMPTPGSSHWWHFIIYVTVYWLACTQTDCNGYAVQRLLSARDERHATWGYLWFNVAHYVLRPWPWILVAVSAITIYGGPAAFGEHVQDPEVAYLQVLLECSPNWPLGPALAAMLAAYMSTIDTHLNWGASYLTHDLFKAYVSPHASERTCLWISRSAVLVIALCGVACTLRLTSITEGWGWLFGILSGMGVIGILRWLWWRINAWSEILCMIFAGLSTLLIAQWAPHIKQPMIFLWTVPASLIGAAIGTWLFAPEPARVLQAFCDRIRPPMIGWRSVVKTTIQRDSADQVSRSAVGWVCACTAVYLALFGIGDLLLKSKVRGMTMLIAAVLLSLICGWARQTAGTHAFVPSDDDATASKTP